MNGINPEQPFKAIIVGAGVGGLTLAHCLHRAGIDYVVLDKHPVAPAWGASISIFPQGARILHQLGLLEAVHRQSADMYDFYNRGPDGKSFCSGPFLKDIQDRAGYVGITLERRAYLRTLYEELPDKSKVIEHARVSDIIEEQSRVKVVLSDGTTHEGDIVVGCDGVHSAVREIMWQRAHRLSPGLITAEEKQSMKTEYCCLIGIAPNQYGLGTNEMTSVSNDRFSFLFLTQPDNIYFIVPIKLPPNLVCKYPNRLRWTDADAEAKAAELADCPVSDTLVFGDIWKTRTRGQIVSLEEGILKHWFYGRMVLCGDAAHKVTPNAGLGGNLSMESAVVLANQLHAAVNRHPNKKPSDEEIKLAFQRYYDIRVPRVKELFDISWVLTRMQAWDGWLWYFVQRWGLPVIGLKKFAEQVASSLRGAPTLSYVPFHQKVGLMEWHKQEWEVDQKAKNKMNSGKRPLNGLIAPVVLTTLALYVGVMWFLGINTPRIGPGPFTNSTVLSSAVAS
ncbi:hypothetical protein DL767_002703 [Monosporascus sp. MG133]|nr:hypothetical protein DL767_002703 [Monosporascus sp. MG133]